MDSETESETLADADWLTDSDSEVKTDSLKEIEVLMDSETDSEILADAVWLIDSDSEVEIDSLVETEVLKDFEPLTDVD